MCLQNITTLNGVLYRHHQHMEGNFGKVFNWYSLVSSPPPSPPVFLSLDETKQNNAHLFVQGKPLLPWLLPVRNLHTFPERLAPRMSQVCSQHKCQHKCIVSPLQGCNSAHKYYSQDACPARSPTLFPSCPLPPFP